MALSENGSTALRVIALNQCELIFRSAGCAVVGACTSSCHQEKKFCATPRTTALQLSQRRRAAIQPHILTGVSRAVSGGPAGLHRHGFARLVPRRFLRAAGAAPEPLEGL